MSGDDVLMNFEGEINKAPWSLLRDHYIRGALFVAKDELDLVEVGKCMAVDNVDQVRLWLEEGLLYRPTDKQIETWEGEEDREMADFVIVSPFVVMQLVYHS